jgi:hypothetical protein
MANEEKNIPEENLNEETANENISQQETIEQPEAQNIKNETEEMEVHHHPHVEKKNFKEYFLEFVMIFLAVTMGFFAEGIRENVTDHAKENEYILSMMQDLRDDTTSMSTAVNELTAISKDLDTMLIQLKNGTPNVAVLNHIATSHFWMYAGFSYNNRTIQQLKNAGNFRLLKNEAVADSILQYDNLINTFTIAQWNDLKNTMYAYKDVEAKIMSYQQLSKIESSRYTFNDSVFVKEDKNSLITNDRQMLSLYYNRLFIHASLMRLFISNLGYSKISAIRLMNFIAKQYNLEND